MKLDAKLLGTPRVLTDERAVSLPYKKADALLYYLIYKGKASRTELVELLWPDVDTQTALKNLRHAIYSIRKELGWDPFSGGSRSILKFSKENILQCDAVDFLKSGDPELYNGEFLKDFTVPKTAPFEDWMLQERSILSAHYLKSLLDMGRDAFQQGDLELATRCCQAYVEQDPLEESAVVLLMRIYCAQQQFRKAIGLYHDLCKNLSNEFGISPLKETTSLYYRIVDQWNASTYRLEADSEYLLLGKNQALRKLVALVTSKERRRPCLLLEGEAGVGKTHLLDYVLEHYDFSDWLICRSACYQTETSSFLSSWNSIMLSLAAELELRRIMIPEVYVKTAASIFPFLAPDLGAQLASSDQDYLSIVGNLLAEQNHTAEYGIYLRLLGLLRIMEGQYRNARGLLDHSIQTFLALDSDMNGRYAINIAGVYNYMAESCRLEGDYPAAFHYYDQAISYNRSRGYYPGAAVIYTNYGVAAHQNGQIREARKLFRYAVEIYTDSHEYSEYPISLSYLALYDAQDGNYSKAAEKLRDALSLCDVIGSPWWKGITLYISWKIRQLMQDNHQHDRQLEAFWPVSEDDHCRWCLSFLEKLPPRIEKAEIEQELLRIASL